MDKIIMLFIKNLKFIILFVVVFSSKVLAECGETYKNTKDFLNKNTDSDTLICPAISPAWKLAT